MKTSCLRLKLVELNFLVSFNTDDQSKTDVANAINVITYVMIYTKNEEEHLNRLRTIFERFRRDNLKLKPSKYNLFQKEITYLAHDVSTERIRPSKASLKAVAEFLEPTNYTQITVFLGLVGHYLRFKGFSKIA